MTCLGVTYDDSGVGQVDLIVPQGATFREPFAWREDDGTTVIPMTGYTARMQVRPSHRSSTVLLSLVSPGDLLINEPLGELTILITDTATAALAAGEYVYDLELIDSGGSGDVYRWIEGSFTVTPEVTR